MFTVNLYYTGKNGAARRFAEEMESSGTASAIRGKPGNARYEYFSRSTMRRPSCLSTAGQIRRRLTLTMPRPRCRR